MTAKSPTTIATLAGVLLVGAQFARPAWPGFHTWQYAAALFLSAMVVAVHLVKQRVRTGDRARLGLLLAWCGVVAIDAAGLASGLLGPDSDVLTRAPGTVAPVADAGLAAFFSNADARKIAQGDATIVLRGRNGDVAALQAGSRTFSNAAALEARSERAAYVEARDLRGNRLTITQPTNQTFLSPVLLFGRHAAVAGRILPLDGFAVPAAHRQVRALYFAHDALPPNVAPRFPADAILFAVDDDAGRPVPRGIVFAAPDADVTVGGLRLRATPGTYPVLVVSAIPPPAPLWLGVLALAGGLLLIFLPVRRRAATLAAAMLLLAIQLGGCARIGGGGEGGGGLHSWTKPDTVRIGMYQEPDSVDPVISSMAFSSDVDQLVFDGLIRYDDTGTPVPDLAREVPSSANGGISKDGRTLTYHLMPNVRWHDGVPFSSADVAFTWRQLMNPKNNTPTRNGYDRIIAVETPDALTVRVRLSGPYPPALYLFRGLNQGAIVPKHLLERYDSLNRVGFNTKPIGTGPYIFRSWQHGGEMRFDANPAYFRGPPKIPHVLVRFIQDQNSLLSSLKAHDIDLYYNVPAQQVDDVRAISGVVVAQRSTLHWEHLVFNTRRKPLDDVRVRLALCYATDEDTLFTKIYRGLGTKGPVHFNPDFEWADRSIVHYPYDPKKAGELLETAGWKLGSDGVRRRGGAPLAVVISTVAGVKNREAIEVLLQNWWRGVGVDVSIKNFPAATLFAPYHAGGMLYGGKTDVAIFTWQNNTPDPDDVTYIAPESIPPAGQNVSFYQNAQIGAWQQAALRTYDKAKRRALYFKIQRVLIDQVPEYVLDWQPEITASNVDLVGVKPVPVGSDLWNVADWHFVGRQPL